MSFLYNEIIETYTICKRCPPLAAGESQQEHKYTRGGMGRSPINQARAAAYANTRTYDPAPCEACPSECKVSSYSKDPSTRD